MIKALTAAVLLAVLPVTWLNAADAPRTSANTSAKKEAPVAVHAVLIMLDGLVKAILFVDQYGDVVAIDVHNCPDHSVCATELERLMQVDKGVGAIKLDSAPMAIRPDPSRDTQI